MQQKVIQTCLICLLVISHPSFLLNHSLFLYSKKRLNRSTLCSPFPSGLFHIPCSTCKAVHSVWVSLPGERVPKRGGGEQLSFSWLFYLLALWCHSKQLFLDEEGSDSILAEVCRDESHAVQGGKENWKSLLSWGRLKAHDFPLDFWTCSFGHGTGDDEWHLSRDSSEPEPSAYVDWKRQVVVFGSSPQSGETCQLNVVSPKAEGA